MLCILSTSWIQLCPRTAYFIVITSKVVCLDRNLAISYDMLFLFCGTQLSDQVVNSCKFGLSDRMLSNNFTCTCNTCTLVNTHQIVNVIQKYSAKKATGCDEISIAMLQLCATEVALPLSLIFQKCLSTGTFPDLWKRANVQPILKKNNRQIKSNYRPISPVPICGKILKK